MRECIECGTTFEAARHNVKVCSDACRKKRNAQKSRRYYHRKKRECPPAPKVFAPRDCAICEAAFDPSVEYTLPHGGLVKRNTGRMYCSDECATEAILRKLRNPIASRECEKCGTAFETNIPHRRFCSDRCRLDTWNNLPENRVSSRIRRGIRGVLTKTKKNSGVFRHLGYDKHQLVSHLESQFVEGMSWDNMDNWHIDHIRPVASFTFNSVDDPEFKACWALENLQPLWATDNLSKGAKWEGAQ